MTRSPTPDSKRGYPLHLHISLVCLCLIFTCGLLIELSNYIRTRESLVSAASQTFHREAENALEALYLWQNTAYEISSYLSRSDLARANTFSERQKSLPLLFDTVQHNPIFDGVYCSYEDGGMFFFRTLTTPTLRQFYKAPQEAVYVLESREREQPEVGNRVIYYDESRNILAERPWSNPVNYDPRQRHWYQDSINSPAPILSQPFVSLLTGQMTQVVARRSEDSRAVMAVNISGLSVDNLITLHKPYPSAVQVIVSSQLEVLIDSRLAGNQQNSDSNYPPTINTLDDHLLLAVSKHLDDTNANELSYVMVNGDNWFISINETRTIKGVTYYLVMMAPEKEILAEARAQARRGGYLTALVLLLAVPITWFFARRITRDLSRLSTAAQSIRRFDFDSSARVYSNIKEIQNLSANFDHARSTMRRFLDLSAMLASERDFGKLLEITLTENLGAVEAQAGVIYLVSEDSQSLTPQACVCDSELFPTGKKTDGNICSHYALEAINIKNQPDNQIVLAMFSQGPLIEEIQRADIADSCLYQALKDLERVLLISTPLKGSRGAAVGVLVLYRRHDLKPPNAYMLSFIEKLSGGAAVAIEKHRLIMEQKNLLDSMIRLLAGAIDAKSPYTGGHCQRIPFITKMLATEVDAVTSGPFADFHLTPEGWETLRLASWLHDCGKVTTPEHVVDKATKLETVYNRIHEVRARFEILKRDQEILILKEILNGADREEAITRLHKQWQALDDDYSFVAECNLGNETLSEESLQRLLEIASHSWQRTIDDRQGLSWAELDRVKTCPLVPLPALEKLLDDKTEHLIERTASDLPPPENGWNFKLKIPPYKYNLGELTNLSIKNGTLSEEERYKINDHIVQTITLLSHLALPKHLEQVPEIAGGHHERVDGRGYPRGLVKNNMSVEARIIAVADVFEALTARDRPYKKSKTISVSLRIMADMARNGHLDRDLFEVFVKSGIYKRYAEEYLAPEQLDPVDAEALLSLSWPETP